MSDSLLLTEIPISSFNIPLERPGNVDDVAALVTFLVSSSAGYLTGTRHIVDGGLLPTV
jgi:NAD(P)-dependent dehydrogenase (short-subunit alcohol dehydrogenase family)